MKASLLHLVLHVATILLLKVAQHLAKHKFQFNLRHLFGISERLEALVCNVECSGIAVGRIFRSIHIATAQLLYMLDCTEYRTYYNLVRRQMVHHQ